MIARDTGQNAANAEETPCPFCHVPVLGGLDYCPHCGSLVGAPLPQDDYTEFFDNSLERASALRLMGVTTAILGMLLFFAPGFNATARSLLGSEMMILGILCVHFSRKEYRCPCCGTPVDLHDVFREDNKQVLCHNCYARLR